MSAVFCVDTYPSPTYWEIEMPTAHGSGFFISSDGLAVTNYHVIADAYIDEYQFMATGSVGVPNSEADFGASFPEGKVLASKKVNAAAYSENMKKAGSTVDLATNYAAIEDYVTGKTVAEVEAAFAGKTAEEAVDVVSGCTLVDTLGYVNGLIEAAKSVK